MKLTKKILIAIFGVVLSITSVLAVNSITSNNNSSFKTTTVYAESMDEKIEKAIARAEYILNYRWTAVDGVQGWDYYFYSGGSYTIPYSQPYMHGGYLFYNLSLEYFEQRSQIAGSEFYTENSTGGTYYGLDCSAFASFCLGVPQRCTTYTFESWANAGSNGFYYKDYSSVSKGDLLNSNSVGHVLVVGDVSGDYISCYESTPQYSSGRADICYTTKTKSQWSSIGYYVLGYDYRGTGAPYDDVTSRLASYDKDNHVLGDCTQAKAETSWDLSENYSPNNENYANRVAVLNQSSGDNTIYFNQSNALNITAQSTFTVTGKESSELYGKFGLAFVNTSDIGFLFYCNAQGTEGSDISNITGTSIGLVFRDSSNWKWGTETEVENLWSPSSPVTLKIERLSGYFKCYVNGKLVFDLLATDCGLEANEKVYPQIRSFNIHLRATNYSSVSTHNSIAIDGDLSDWQANENWSKIEADKKTVADKNNANKNATFYHRLTDEGLFIYAIAHHTQTTSGREDWWENTNFELFINSDDNSAQFYVTEDLVHVFTSFSYSTTGSSGNYTSILEAFIDTDTLESKADYNGESLKIGYAFKVDDGTTKDEITPTGTDTATSYWCAENSEPRNVAHTVDKEISYSKDYLYSVSDKGYWTFNGNDLSISQCLTDGDDIVYFRNNATTNHTFSATFSLTGKVATEEYGKVGIAYLDEYGDGFFFYANAEGTKDKTDVASITGTTFGLVFCEDGGHLWDDSKSKEFTEATFSADKPFTMKVVRTDETAKLYANDILLTTITLSDYKIPDNRLCYPALMTFNIYANATNVGFTDIKQGDITFDGNLSDWEKLSSWKTIQNNKVTVTDKTDASKGVTFYTLLNDEGLFIAVKATHSVNLTGYSNWWKNTNVEAFIGFSDFENQFYATKQFRRGWTKSEFTTTGTSGNYTTIFEGFIDYKYLTNVCSMKDNQIKIGLAFKVDNLNGTADKITPTGTTPTGAETTATSYWCAENTDPLALNLTVKKYVEPAPTPETSSSSKITESSSSSKETSSSTSKTTSTSSSSKTISSSSSKTISSSSSSSSSSSVKKSVTDSSSKTQPVQTSSKTNNSGKKGCKSFASSDILALIPLALLAMVVMAKKSKKD